MYIIVLISDVCISDMLKGYVNKNEEVTHEKGKEKETSIKGNIYKEIML